MRRRDSNAADTTPPRPRYFHEDPEEDALQRHLAASTFYLLDHPLPSPISFQEMSRRGQAHALAALAHIEAEKMEKGRMGRR